MKTSEAERRSDLRAPAEGLIEDGLAKGPGLKRMADVEELGSETRRRVGQALEVELLEEQGQVGGAGSVCDGCGQEMGYKGDKTRYVVTRTGEQQLKRGYNYGPDSERGLFPSG